MGDVADLVPEDRRRLERRERVEQRVGQQDIAETEARSRSRRRSPSFAPVSQTRISVKPKADALAARSSRRRSGPGGNE